MFDIFFRLDKRNCSKLQLTGISETKDKVFSYTIWFAKQWFLVYDGRGAIDDSQSDVNIKKFGKIGLTEIPIYKLAPQMN